jgi:hypothetical protein
MKDSGIKKKLAVLYWDADVEPAQLERLLRGDIERIGHIDRINLYRRLLMTYDWYTLLTLIPPERLQEALSEPVIEHLHPASLKDRYLYARSILFKIDFVNDVMFHYGDFQEAPFFPRIDHWRNILSNKLCALSRREPKDMADILFMAKRFQFSWPEIFNEARQKDLWVEPLEISKIIHEFPVSLLGEIKWVQPVDLEACATALKTLHQDIFHGRSNSLCQ